MKGGKGSEGKKQAPQSVTREAETFKDALDLRYRGVSVPPSSRFEDNPPCGALEHTARRRSRT